jgi:hypothetical protein
MDKCDHILGFDIAGDQGGYSDRGELLYSHECKESESGYFIPFRPSLIFKHCPICGEKISWAKVVDHPKAG